MERIRKIPDDSDRVSPDEDDEDMSPYEPTYRDGSAKNECWQARRRASIRTTSLSRLRA